jgi:hypothetical protein
MIDPESKCDHYYVKVRESMVKFQSNDWTLDICDYSRPSKVDIRDGKSGPGPGPTGTKFFPDRDRDQNFFEWERHQHFFLNGTGT